jgi:serine/threonine-protein kinase
MPSARARALERFVLASDEGPLAHTQAIAPDGARVAYATPAGLWIRELDRLEPRLLPGTEGARAPFWSPASDRVGYQLGPALWQADLERGEAMKICDVPLGVVDSPGWGEDGSIVFQMGGYSFSTRVMRVPAQGGAAEVVLSPDRAAGERRFSSVNRLPEGRGIVTGVERARGFEIQIRDDDGRLLSARPSEARVESISYSPTGHLLFSDRSLLPSQLWAVPFSLERLEMLGGPVLVARGAHDASVARDGTLVHLAFAPRPQRLLWVSRSGVPLEHVGPAREFIFDPSVSHDGDQVAFLSGAGDRSEQDLYLQGAGRATPVRLTLGQTLSHPAFSPGGDRVTYNDRAADALGSIALHGAGTAEPEPLLGGGVPGWGPHWSADGRRLVFYRIDPATGRDLWYLDMETGGEPVPYLVAPRDQLFPRLSPDGRYLAYQSDERDQWQIYVETFPERTRRWLVSETDGRHPRWSTRGDELFFVAGDSLMSARVTLAPAFQAGAVERLFDGADVGARLSQDENFDFFYDVGPGGERFLVVEGLGMGRADVVLVRNWDLAIESSAASD